MGLLCFPFLSYSLQRSYLFCPCFLCVITFPTYQSLLHTERRQPMAHLSCIACSDICGSFSFSPRFILFIIVRLHISLETPTSPPSFCPVFVVLSHCFQHEPQYVYLPEYSEENVKCAILTTLSCKIQA